MNFGRPRHISPRDVAEQELGKLLKSLPNIMKDLYEERFKNCEDGAQIVSLLEEVRGKIKDREYERRVTEDKFKPVHLLELVKGESVDLTRSDAEISEIFYQSVEVPEDVIRPQVRIVNSVPKNALGKSRGQGFLGKIYDLHGSPELVLKVVHNTKVYKDFLKTGQTNSVMQEYLMTLQAHGLSKHLRTRSLIARAYVVKQDGILLENIHGVSLEVVAKKIGAYPKTYFC